MYLRMNHLLARGLACWLLACPLAGGVDAADPAPESGDSDPAAPPAAIPKPQDGDKAPDEKKEKNWIDNNIVLFMFLVHGSWIIPLGIWIVVARRIARRRKEKRTNDLQAVAKELELPFLETGDTALGERLSNLPLFNIGRARTLTNLIVADTPELQIALFDYRYVTGRGKHKRVRRQSVAVVQSTSLRLPEFHLRPERKLDAVGSLLGLQDIDFDHHPDFSKAFVLKSLNEQETRDFFDQELLDFFATQPGISFEAAPGMFVYFRRWKRVDPLTPEMRGFLGEAYLVQQALQERLSRG